MVIHFIPRHEHSFGHLLPICVLFHHSLCYVHTLQNVTVNFNCFHIFSTEIMNYRAYFTVVGIFNERRHFKYVQMNVNTLEWCCIGGCRLPTDVGIQCVRADDTVRSAAAEEFQHGTYLKNMPCIYRAGNHFCEMKALAWRYDREKKWKLKFSANIVALSALCSVVCLEGWYCFPIIFILFKSGYMNILKLDSPFCNLDSLYILDWLNKNNLILNPMSV